MNDALSQFRDALRAAGLEPPEVIEPDGKLHRFASNGKPHDDAGWYVFHDDGIPAGAFGDWRTGLSETWRADIGRKLSPGEETAYRAHVETIRRQREAEETRYRTEAAKKAKEIWEAAAPASEDHPYLIKKRVKSYGLRVHEGKLVVPVRDGDALHSLQFIAPDGDKRFLTGGRVSGCYFLIGEPDKVLCIAEGYATAAAIHEATGYAVAVAFNAGNLLPVAKALRAKFSGLRIIVCADDDHRTEGNPGKTKASEAAAAIEGLLAIPDFGEDKPDRATDFDDLMECRGLEAVRRCVELATTPGEAIKAVTKCLSALPVIHYDQTRKAEAHRLGIRVATLDKEVIKARGETAEEGQGRKFEFDSVEPWPEAVDGALLLDELVAYFRRFLVLPEYAPEAISLWTLHTYLMDVIYTTPYLAFLSPEKRCGKTRGLVASSFVCANPLLNTSISPAALFRIIEKHAPTTLIDEFDTFLKNDELRGILNAGYTRDTAKVPRCVGDDHEPREFSVWAPKAFALIGKLPSTLEDRTIVIRMKRKLPDEKVDRLRSRCRERFKPLRQKCVRFAADIRLQIQHAEPPLPEELNDRGQDIWEPLLAIADAAGGNWPKRARQAAVALSGGDGADDDSFNVQLLADIREVFTVKLCDRIPTVELIEALIGMDERPWGEANWGKPITTRWLAAKLKPFGIVRGTKRSGASTFKGYTLAQFVDVFQRYLDLNRSHGHNVETARVSEEFEEVTDQSCDLSENGLKASKSEGCDPATFSDRENGAVDETEPRSWRARI